MKKVFRNVHLTLEMIKFEHTLFALPFAFLGAFLAARGIPGIAQILWIIVAMFGARSAAMAFNRLVDHHIDGLNPRTQERALPSGLLSRKFVIYFIMLFSTLFIVAAWRLNSLALKLAPLALCIIFFYSITKRFTWLSHLFLGLALACAPMGGWIAVKGKLDLAPLVLGIAVALWIAGSDVIYSCMDAEFDSRMGLHSIPQRWGVSQALRMAILLHVIMMGLLLWAVWLFNLNWLAWVGLVIVSLLLLWEHRLVTPGDFSRVPTAFFTLNATISATLFVSTAVDLLLLSSP